MYALNGAEDSIMVLDKQKNLHQHDEEERLNGIYKPA